MVRPTVIEVFADVGCPFTHVGLRRFVERRAALDRDDVVLRVRAWPLEVVNGSPLDPHVIAEEVDDIRDQAAPDLFVGFDEAVFPATSLPAMAVAAAGYDVGSGVGEQVSLELRDLLFEQGVDIADDAVLRPLAARHGIEWDTVDTQRVLHDHAEGVTRNVIGSPHFFVPAGDYFCPALNVSRDAGGHLRVQPDIEAFEAFLTTCFEG